MSSSKVCFQLAKSGHCRKGLSCKYDIAGTKGTKSKNTPQASSYKRTSPKDPWQQGSSQGTSLSTGPAKQSHMDGFFANYPSFQHDRQAPLVQEFYRMCDQFEGKKDDDEKKDALSGFKTAMVHRLNTLCGTDVEDIESWRKPCLALDIMPPDGLQACRKARLLVVRGEVVGDLIGQAVRKLYINIGDLVDTQDSIGRVAICETLEEWRTYTIESGKCFPKQAAQAGGVLKFLLRQILNKHVNNTREGV